jgi:sugar-specific transcriptional regulator TrmB
LSQDQVLKTLVGLGLTQSDSQIYICLAKKGPQKGSEISKGLKIQKQQLYRSLKNLQSKGIVDASLEHPARFSAVSFDKVVDIFIKAKMAEANLIEENKEEILASWKAMAVGETQDASAKFTVIEGRGPIYSRILQMVKETKNQLSSITTVAGLLRADQFGLFDAGFNDPPKSQPRFRFLTELSVQSLPIMRKLFKEMGKKRFGFIGKTPGLSLGLFPQMIIKDESEAIFFITAPTEKNEVCLWTNCKSLVQAFLAIFEDLWHNAIDVNKKIEEIENGKTDASLLILKNAEEARTKYYETLESAEQEIMMINSLENLKTSSESFPLLNERAERNVISKIMVPITTKNWAIAQQLSKHYDVRHIPAGYLNTTIVDGKHLFQFSNKASLEQEKDKNSLNFENMFYSDDFEYIDKAKKVLSSIWENAPANSPVTLESVLAPTKEPISHVLKKIGFNGLSKTVGVTVAEDNQECNNLTEKDVITRIIEGPKHFNSPSDDIVRLYSFNGQAIIHPPSHLSLPEIIVYLVHTEKHSTFGIQDFMHIVVKRETPSGPAFLPSVFVYDNPAATEYWKKYFAGVPSGSNLQLVKKDELQVQLHGNILSAAWTVPIALIPQLLTLPPGCIMLEGYGNLRTEQFTLNLVSGYRMACETNGFDAFVTFLHPSSNYSGPGTDGFLCRDVIQTIYPPN